MLVLALGAGAGLWLPAQFSDHMVLQRETRVALWGSAAPGAAIEVHASFGAEARARSAADGTWRLELETGAAGGPHELVIRVVLAEQGAERVEERVLHDVLVGEVWLASGQSNMEWTLGPGIGNGVEGWQNAVREPDPWLRAFDVANAQAPAPARAVAGQWSVAGAETSAVAFFFGRKLRAELGIPVGLITSTWGGTVAEAWTSAAGLGDFPEFTQGLAALAREAGEAGTGAERQAEAQAAALAEWWRALERHDPLAARLAEPLAAGASGWSRMELPDREDPTGLAAFDGVAWYRRSVSLPAAWTGRELVLELGAIDDRDTTFWNGKRIGGLEGTDVWETPRSYRIPGAEVARANQLVVRVVDTGGPGGFSGPAAVLRVFPAGDEGAALPLAADWLRSHGVELAALGYPPDVLADDPNRPSVLWNGMIAPLVPCAVRGVIWYQGEANIERARQYRALFPALIRDWRAHLGRGTLPFYFVQIAPFGYEADHGEAASLRDAQRRTLALERTGMAVTMDIGDPADIHPLQKLEVGERLALWALARDYGQRELECSGPLYRSLTREAGALRLAFDHAEGLTTRGAPLAHLTLAGKDRVFHPAEARVEGETLLVSSSAVPAPEAARFGWGAADATNLWNAAGLPAASFRTDDWP